MPSTGINGAPILILGLDEVLLLEEIMIESPLVKFRDPLFVKILEFKSEAVSLARRNLRSPPDNSGCIFQPVAWEKPFLAGLDSRERMLCNQKPGTPEQAVISDC